MKFKYLLGAAAPFLFVSSAYAQDAGGFRVEAVVGYDSISSDSDDEEFESEASDGVVFGAGAGYDFAVGGVVLGVEAELTESTVGESISGSGDFDGFDVDGEASLDAGLDLYVGGRIGVVVANTGLIYAKAGYTKTNAEFEVDGTIDGDAINDSIDFDFDGLRLGAGAQFGFGTNMYGKIEYRYTSYGDASVGFDGVTVDLDDVFDYGDIDRHQVVVGLGFRF